MASLLFSISFLMPLSVPKFSFKELQLRKSAVSRLSGQPTSGTATNLLVICNATGEILSVNQSCGGCPTTPTTHFYELVSSCMHGLQQYFAIMLRLLVASCCIANGQPVILLLSVLEQCKQPDCETNCRDSWSEPMEAALVEIILSRMPLSNIALT
ncbi:hypothetical protein OIU85_019650 [Salix viminalis]|uniref:Uncharacterized protein n=1 Tax=Salix viminalis TaxID=40686 RepID=A0A9Q0ZKB5_SALVM|nr:hypothetical protein OIU85_019650 [Salix viminalis]